MSSAPDHIYLDLAVMNNDTTGQDRRPINFYETRTNPIIDNPSNYFMSVVRFEVDTPAITVPLFIPKLLINGLNEDKNKTAYSITIGKPSGGKLTDWYQRYVTWFPEDKTAKDPINLFSSSIAPSIRPAVTFLPLFENTLPVTSSTIVMPTESGDEPNTKDFVFNGESATYILTSMNISSAENNVRFSITQNSSSRIVYNVSYFGAEILGLQPLGGVSSATWLSNILITTTGVDGASQPISIQSGTINSIDLDSPFPNLFRYSFEITFLTPLTEIFATVNEIQIVNNNLQCLDFGGAIPLCVSSDYLGEVAFNTVPYSQYNMTLDKPYLDIEPVSCGIGTESINNEITVTQLVPINDLRCGADWYSPSVGFSYPFDPTAFNISSIGVDSITYNFQSNVLPVGITNPLYFKPGGNENFFTLIVVCTEAELLIPAPSPASIMAVFTDQGATPAYLTANCAGYSISGNRFQVLTTSLSTYEGFPCYELYINLYDDSPLPPMPSTTEPMSSFILTNGRKTLFPTPTEIISQESSVTSASDRVSFSVRESYIRDNFPWFSTVTVKNSSNISVSIFDLITSTGQILNSRDEILPRSVQFFDIQMSFRPDVLVLNTQDVTTGYYNCYSARWWLNCVNRTLSELWTDLAMPTSNPTAGVPQFVIDAGTNLITLMTPFDTTNKTAGQNANFAVSGNVAPTAEWEGTGSVPAIEFSMFFNQPMFNLFSSMPFIFYGRKLTNILDPPINTALIPEGVSILSYYVQPTNYEFKNFLVQNDATIETYNWFITTSEYSPVPMWNPIMSLVFTTSLIPVQLSLSNPPTVYGGNVADETFSNGGGNNSQINNQISDIEIPLTTGSEYKPQVVYYPAAEYRCLDLLGNSPINSVSFQVLYKTKFGQLIPVILGSQCGANLKIMFRRKRFNLGNVEPYNTN
jgi:hypothetical protein